MDTNCSLTIQQLCALYEQHARTTFIKPSTGQPTATWKNIRSVGRALCAAEKLEDLVLSGPELAPQSGA